MSRPFEHAIITGLSLFRLADLMDQHREELATIESLDSGAVYTLALKTHVGMSIDTFKYFAGWADKIQVSRSHIFIDKVLTIAWQINCQFPCDDRSTISEK